LNSAADAAILHACSSVRRFITELIRAERSFADRLPNPMWNPMAIVFADRASAEPIIPG
jgi:hypothetical protein